MDDKKARKETAARQNHDAQEEKRVLPKDPGTLNPNQKGPAQPSDSKTNPT